MSIPPRTKSAGARALAAEVLQRVFSEDAFAAATLSHALSHSALQAKDKGLATELVYGSLRVAPFLVRWLGEYGKIKQSDHVLVSHLIVAGYQLAFLDRIPAHAAVDEAVSALTEARGRQVAGFANAILRKLAADAVTRKVSYRDAVLSSCPSWLRKRLVRDVGEQEATALLVPVESPRPYVRFLRHAPLPAWTAEQCTAVAVPAHMFRFDGGGDPRQHPEFEQGAFVVQELGAALVGYALGVAQGERVLDVCAGRGQKTMILAEAVGPSGEVVATDLHANKVSSLKAEALRLGLSVSAEVWDWTTPPPDKWRGHFDRVLVDAPCTGVGTLRRRPEIMRRLSPDAPARLAELQWSILSSAALTVRPGGVLLFATCSVLQEEGPALVSRLCEGGAFEPTQPVSEADVALRAEGESVPAMTHLLPLRHGTDGYFVARLKKR